MNTAGNNDDQRLREALKGNGPGMDFSDSVMKQVLAGARNSTIKRRWENKVMLMYAALTFLLLLLLIVCTQPIAGFDSIRIPELKTVVFNNPDLLTYSKIAMDIFILAFICLGVHLARRRILIR